MIIRLDNNTIVEIKKSSFINDNEYYKYLMNNALRESPKFSFNKDEFKKKNVDNVVDNSNAFIEKFITLK